MYSRRIGGFSLISIHAPRVGCDCWRPGGRQRHPDFNPRTPCGVRPTAARTRELSSQISIHAPRVGCDMQSAKPYGFFSEFQSTHPVWGATQSIGRHPGHRVISIHAPRVGCDQHRPVRKYHSSNFNPRTPCGVRRSNPSTASYAVLFQSTHPVWGATALLETVTLATPISIHAPRVGCDWPRSGARNRTMPHFNPRTPCGVRPIICVVGFVRIAISIHAPRVGCDGFRWIIVPEQHKFQSTHPVWGATANLYKVRGESLCSLHRLHSINSKCYNYGGEKISTPYINWKNMCANLPGML